MPRSRRHSRPPGSISPRRWLARSFKSVPLFSNSRVSQYRDGEIHPEAEMTKRARTRRAIASIAFLFPLAAWANISGTATLPAGTGFSFDKGEMVGSGGDILFAGNSITLEGAATVFDFGKDATGFNSLVAAGLTAIPASVYNQAPISGSSLVVNEVFAVHTTGGNYAKALITAVSASSLSFKYTTFDASTSGGGGGGGGAPSVTEVRTTTATFNQVCRT